MRVVVGCPVRRREWSAPAWLLYVDAALRRVAQERRDVVSARLVFVADPKDPTLAAIDRTFASDEESVLQRWPIDIVECDEDVTAADTRDWATSRYRRMAELRNLLLGHVRELEPDLFLSLDSDILLHPDALVDMVQVMHERSFGAVGGKAYMTEVGTVCPSYGTFTAGGGLHRLDSDGAFPVDVIMAIKLLGPAAYQVDYVADGEPEDIGWCKAARRAGVSIGWTGKHCSKHLMRPDMLDKIDERVGF